MPNPIEILLDPISLIVISMYILLFAWETLFPARQLPAAKFWVLRGTGMFFLFFYLSSYLPLLWDQYLEPFQLLDLSKINPWVGILCGVLLYEFGMYVWHRSMHQSDLLWRTVHQVHHSTERLDIPSAFYFSPLDMIGWTMLGSICFVVIMGLPAQSATGIILITNFLGMFQHANIRTPQWLGYVVQRPESHTVHHAKGIHAHNYSDLPIFDMIFGTFRNPKTYEHETGFYPGASLKMKDMLTFKDINKAMEEVKEKEEQREQVYRAFSDEMLSKNDGL